MSILFFGLAAREIKRVYPDFDQITKEYFYLMIFLGCACLYRPIQFYRIEKLFSAKSTVIADGRRVTVHCNSLFDAMFSRQLGAIGWARRGTGEVTYEIKWCGYLMDYINDPKNADDNEIYSMNMFTHEAMHVRGEINEQRTECQSIQRLYRASKLFGIPDEIAKKNSVYYYEKLYPKMPENYFSKDCAPGKALDEQLPDSTWNWIERK